MRKGFILHIFQEKVAFGTDFVFAFRYVDKVSIAQSLNYFFLISFLCLK